MVGAVADVCQPGGQGFQLPVRVMVRAIAVTVCRSGCGDHASRDPPQLVLSQGLVQLAGPGSAVLPLGRLAWNPHSPTPPGAKALLCPVPRAVTVCPLTVTAAFHEPVRVCPGGRVNVTVQPEMLEVPVLVTRTG
jgi:hypothetical protein